MKYAVFTSMNKPYYENSGWVMLESVRKMWKPLRVFVYNEDFDTQVKNVINFGWNLGTEYDKFQERWQPENKKIAMFAKKGFSIIHAMEYIDADKLIWIDADCQATLPINLQLLELLSPDDTLSTHFGVQHFVDDKSYFSCETGFFVINRRHEMFEEFKKTYTDIYVNDDYKDLRRFYDGEVYGETVRRLQLNGAKMLDLNPGHKHKTPIPRSVIAPYLCHYKAGLKDNIDFQEKKKLLQDDED